MKRKRHDKILEIIVSKTIYTQEQLLAELERAGFFVTQATVSRDIKELCLMKERTRDGICQYVSSAKGAIHTAVQKGGTIFDQSVLQVTAAMNMVSIKCRTGMANAACAILDDMKWGRVIGTLAGDDTIFVLMRSEEDAAAFAQEMRQYLAERN